MSRLAASLAESEFIGLCLEGFFYGLYSGIFAVYLQSHPSTNGTNKTTNILFYLLCALYVLCLAALISDIASFLFSGTLQMMGPLQHLTLIQTTITGCCDFISQYILVYRCWIVWGCNIRVVIIPSILVFAFLATWLAGSSHIQVFSNKLISPEWGYPMSLTSLAISLTVNALVTGLIVFKIFKVYRELMSASDDQNLGVTGGSKIRTVIFVLIESGMVLFSVQLARVVVTIVSKDATFRAYELIIGIHQMLNGITPTIILVRVSMGLSFHDTESMTESTIGSLRFAANNPNSIPEAGTLSLVRQERRDDTDIQLSNNIEIVERDGHRWHAKREQDLAHCV